MPQSARQDPSGGPSISLPGLLLSFLKIGAIGFGGGMAVIALMERELVRRRRLIDADEFLHGIGLGQILGSFAVNASFFVGYRLFGAAGGLLSAGAFLLPSVAIVIALSDVYFRYHSIPALQGAVAGLGPVVIALIVNAGFSIGRKVVRSPAAAVIAVAALAAGAWKINAVWVLFCAGAAGFLLPEGKASANGQSSGPPGPRGSPWTRFRRQAGRGAGRGPGGPPHRLAYFLPAAGAAPGGLAAIVLAFVKIGLVFFGGGFVLLPMLHERLVTSLHWLTAREFIDGVAISNLTPGPIAVLATFAGYRLDGVPGALAATAALFAPGLAFMAVASGQYEKHRDTALARRFLAGVNPAITGLVLSAAVLLGRSAMTTWRGWVAAALSLALLGPLRWYPAVALALGAAAGYAGLLP